MKLWPFKQKDEEKKKESQQTTPESLDEEAPGLARPEEDVKTDYPVFHGEQTDEAAGPAPGTTDAEAGTPHDIPPAETPAPSQPEEPRTPENSAPKESWMARLSKGLSKSSTKMTSGITDIFTKRKLDDQAIEELEDLLIMADMGPATAAKLSSEFAKNRFGKEVGPDEVKEALAGQITQILQPVAKPLQIDESKTPFVILVVGVNGTGKTTTIAKLAQQFRGQGKSVLLAAGDTFRAAAVEQLQIWAGRTGAAFVAKETGADAGAVAYEALERAKKEQMDVVLIDTAGRLHNKAELMEELAKVRRVIAKNMPDAPHETLITLDATTGQNAINQVHIFDEVTPITGLIVTKLDGSAKGGVVVALAEKFNKPVYAIGVGESADDLRPFKAQDYARSLMNLA